MALRLPKATLKILNQAGFSSKLINKGRRLILKNGNFNILRKGKNSFDFYYFIFEISWTRFLSFVLIFLLATNFFFAFMFYSVGIEQLEGINGDQPLYNVLLDCFFFSIQTFTTVGYGSVHPVGTGANWLASILSFGGFFSFSLFTGLSLARFLKPRSKIKFSEVALINFDNDFPSLQFRIVNTRPTKLFSVEATVVMTCLDDRTGLGITRHFSSLKLEYEKIIMLPIDWTIMHCIDESSPLYGLTQKKFESIGAEFLVSIKAYDDAYNQDIHANHSYLYNEIIWDARFHLMYESHDNHTILDMDKLSAFEKIVGKKPKPD